MGSETGRLPNEPIGELDSARDVMERLWTEVEDAKVNVDKIREEPNENQRQRAAAKHVVSGTKGPGHGVAKEAKERLIREYLESIDTNPLKFADAKRTTNHDDLLR